MHDDVDLELDAAAMLEIENGETLTCRSFKLGGVSQKPGALYAVGVGKVYVAYSEGTRTDATWTGKGATAGVSVTENWKDLSAAPDLTGGSLVPYFAETGDRAETDADTFFKGLSFGTAERFELAAADGVSPFKLGSLGMTFALPASGAATNVISAPMTLTCDQTWTFPATSGETLEITGGIGSLTANDVTLNGYGRVILRGSSTFTGSFKTSRGTRVDASARTGAFGIPGESGHNVSLQAVGNTFYGVTVEKPVTIGGGFDDNNYLVTPANCTNVFKGPVTLNYGRLALGGGSASADGGACMRFEGGIIAASRIRIRGWGKAFVTNVPITAKAEMDVESCYDVALSAPSNELTGISLEYGTVSLMTDRALDATNCTVNMKGDGVFTRIRLGGGFQQVGNLSLLSAGKILALQPSVFAFRQTTVVTNTAIDMQGPLSLLKTGPATFAVNRSLSANGMLDVAEGTFAFMENGTWLGATNVTVRGTGRIKLASGNTFARRTTDVSLSETGVLEFGEDVVQHCHNLYVNGTLVKKPGLYGGILAPEGASREYADFFDGKGALFVHGGRPPLVILVK